MALKTCREIIDFSVKREALDQPREASEYEKSDDLGHFCRKETVKKRRFQMSV